MRVVLVVTLVLAVAVGCGRSNAVPSQSTPELVRKIQPLVVEIVTDEAVGSGVIWNENGDVVTNQHVVEGADQVQVVFASGLRVRAKVRAFDRLSDLAVVHVAKHGFRPATFASKLPQVGESALAVGAPFGYASSVSTGIVSGVHRSLPAERGRLGPYVDLIQTTAPISPGSSGGALVNDRGEVIGINTAGIPPVLGASNIGFAIPSTTVLTVVDDLLHRRRVNHPYFGARLADLYPELQQEFQTKVRVGALVVSVESGSPAERAGLVPGMVIGTVNGVKTKTADDVLAAVAHERPGARLRLGLTTYGGTPLFHVLVLGRQRGRR